MEIRKAMSHETKHVKELWKYCFKDTDVFVDWYFLHKYRYENTIVAVEDKIVSALQAVPYTLRLRGSNQLSSYIVGVSTAPEARGMGITPKIMKFAFDDMKNKGINVSILMPFMFSFYTKYGYDLCYHQINHRFEISRLKDIISLGGKFIKGDENNILELKEIYQLFTTGKHGYVIRQEKEWLEIIGDLYTDKGQIYIYLGENNEPKGYIMYYLEGETMVVKEMAYDDIISQRHLYGFIYNHISHLKHVTLRLSMDDLTHFLVPDLNQEMNIYPFMMMRIVDVKNLLASIKYPGGVNHTLSFKIIDEFCSWNETPFMLKVNNEIGVCNELEDSYKVDITCSINALNQIIMGEIDIKDLKRLKKIFLRDNRVVEKLSSIFPRQNNYINEYI